VNARGIDALRARMAAADLAEANRILAERGAAALVSHAFARMRTATGHRDRFDRLAAQLEREPERRTALIAEYLRATVPNASKLRADLRALKRAAGSRFDLPALAERVARTVAVEELGAEVALALARANLEPAAAAAIAPAELVALARVAGRWSRRVEALRTIQASARATLSAEARSSYQRVASDLTRPTEHRWVQPAALAALAAFDEPSARAIALERFAPPYGHDDFLVRERILELAGRPRGRAWTEVLDTAYDDPSEHVRLGLVRAERRADRLVRLARSDPSPKVRALALEASARRFSGRASPLLCAALGEDPAPAVVRTAAEQIGALARGRRLQGRDAALAALERARCRPDLDGEARATLAAELAEVYVATDPFLGVVYDALKSLLAQVPVEGSVKITGTIAAALTNDQLGTILAVLSRTDFALGADRTRDGIVLHRGEPRGWSPWRTLFELFHRQPSKRQGHVHTSARRPRGQLRAPPGGLAELTATLVPGERVYIPAAGGWGQELPLVEDLLDAARWRRRPVALMTPGGTTWIEPPPGVFARLRAAAFITLGYPRLSALRLTSLESGEAPVQTAFVRDVRRDTGIVVRFEPRTFGQERALAPSPPQLAEAVAARTASAQLTGAASAVAPLLLASAPDPLPMVRVVLRDFFAYAQSVQGNRLPHVAAYAAVLFAGMVARSAAMRRSIDRDREALPLVVGGWGTRGKSGTERLKAALLQGLGYECLVKTTGCEAMFIHALPGVPAHEVFLYRPYDKATIWEQRDVLALARRFGVKALLWECMALQPDLVNLLQAQWMRDDYSTITNAYPDHEDVQGPSGYDVAEVISEFVPTRGRLFTSEDQMLPVLRERAAERNTSLRAVDWRDAALVADDVLARFPYHEHPRNIALVTTLAQAFGVPASVALAEMADNVVPDLGVLKTYPTVEHEGRALSFTNGMSANERTGALSNWVRMGFDAHDPDADPARWIVTIVNNREDRVSRSEVFARFIVEDIAAHRHVLIGTNITGLRVYIDQALDRHLAAIAPTRELAAAAGERWSLVESRIVRAFARLKVGRLDGASAAADLAAFGGPRIDPHTLEALLAPARPDETYEQAKAHVERALPAGGDARARPFCVAALAKRRATRALLAFASEHFASRPKAVDRAFAATYRAIFLESLVVLRDSALSGDAIIDITAKSVPPGVHGAIMGLQNIKGTGLDFVYRWVSIEMVERMLAALGSSHPEERQRALGEVLVHDDYGLVDSRRALATVLAARESAGDEGWAPYDAAIARLRRIVDARATALHARDSQGVAAKVRQFVGVTFDFWDSVRRQSMARGIVADLVAGRISHAAAAIAMREVVARAKGAWMVRRS
jgi:poly-gamma-glutamate synthase PgsB/CapB